MTKKRAAGQQGEAVPVLVPAGETTAFRAIDIIRMNFSGAMREIAVEEWPDPTTGKPLVLKFGPMTAADLDAVTAQQKGEESPLTQNLRLLIHKARRADGTAAFSPGDLHYLQHEAPYNVIARLTQFMLASSVTHEEAVDELKNGAGSASSSISLRS